MNMRIFHALSAVVVCGVTLGFLTYPAYAQESLILSVTPPFFQMNASPGDVWKSSVKVVNSNQYDLSVYAQVFDFAPQGEEGFGSFKDPPEGDAGHDSLARWIGISGDAIVIPPEQSMEVPITVTVPADASPGGHFAAILIGTRPPEGGGGAVVRTSQIVTSLFFVRVAGDVEEKGLIREFSVPHLFRESPETDFVLRFQNNGNVHLQPQGGITVFNMWGKERGFIPINQQSHFGNVLPGSVRKFDFSWRGEPSISDIGRYTAEVALTFGEEGRQNVSRKVYFWVIPYKAAALTLAVILALGFFIVWAVRRYVRRALHLAGYEPSLPVSPKHVRPPQGTVSHSVTRADLARPLREGVLDLRTRIKKSDTRRSLFSSLREYVRVYRFFFGGALVAFGFLFVGGYYLSDVLRGQKSYEVTVERGDVDVVISSEEAIREQMQESDIDSTETEAPVDQPFDVTVLNATEVPGAAARVAHDLEKLGYLVARVEHDPEAERQRSAIVFDEGLEDVALTMSRQLGNMLISKGETTVRDASATSSPRIRIIVGADRDE